MGKYSETGVGLALEENESYIFALPGKKHKCPPGKAFFAGIGGHLEKGESLFQCAHREAWEETGLEIDIKDSKDTYFISPGGKIKKIPIEEEKKPWILYAMTHAPGTPREGGQYLIIIFKAGIKRIWEKVDENEIGGLIALTPGQVRDSLKREKKLKELRRDGARILAGGSKIDEETLLYPLGTAKAMAVILSKILR